MSRQFLYMVVENRSVNPLTYTLHRINPSRLFYPKDSPERVVAAAAAGARATTMKAAAAAPLPRTIWMNKAEADVDAEKARLPRPTMTFSSPNEYMRFALTGRNKDQIVAVASAGRFRIGGEGCSVDRAVVYDDASHSVIALPGLTFPRGKAVPIAVGDDLYFAGVEEEDRGGTKGYSYGLGCGGGYGGLSGNHRIFVRGLIRELEDHHQYPDWYWYSFPPPPYSAHAEGTEKHPNDKVAAYAVVGKVDGWDILASTRRHGTYSLCTENGEWNKVSNSALPFCGLAVYAPEHGLWFGLPDDGRHQFNGLLGAWNLHASADVSVEERGLWEFSGPYAYNVRSHLVHLGHGGRFCVAKLFEMPKPPPASRCARCYYDSHPPDMGFAVLIGVEVERCDGGELRMIKHRSFKYRLGLNSANVVF